MSYIPETVDAWSNTIPSQPSGLRPAPPSTYVDYTGNMRPPVHQNTQNPTVQRDGKIFGMPSPSLVNHAAALGDKGQQSEPFLRVRLGTLERNKKELFIRFDVSTNLPSFRTTLYRNIQRSYTDFSTFAEQLAYGNPQTIVPALPLPQTSAVTDEEDDRLVRIAIQRWFARVCDNPILQKYDEIRNFIESDFGYQPTIPRSQMRSRSTASSSSGAFSSLSKVFRRGPPDEDEDLQAAKGELERLEERWAKASSSVNGLQKTRRTFAVTEAETGAKLISLATAESGQDLSLALRSMGRSFEAIAGLIQAQSVHDNVILSDGLGYQSLNAKAAKETLNHRTHVLEDAQTASKIAINKRRVVERMKGSSNINPSKVDDALEDMREAQEHDQFLAQRVQAISTTLRSSLQNHSRRAHEDVAQMLLDHAKSKIAYERQILQEMESVKPVISNIGKGVKGVTRAMPSTGMQRTNSSVGSVMRSPGMNEWGGTGPSTQGNQTNQQQFTPPGVNRSLQGPVGGRFDPPQSRQGQGMSQSMYAAPTQAQGQTQPYRQVQSAYPHSVQAGHPQFQPPGPVHQNQSHLQHQYQSQPQYPSHNPEPLSGPAPNVPHNVHTPPPLGAGPTAQTYNSMAQSLYLPGGSRPPGGYGTGRRIDDRVAARSLANMF